MNILVMLFNISLTHVFARLVADAWRALKSPSLGESSLEGAASGLSTTSPSEGLSVAPGGLVDTPHFNTLAGGALGARTGKYSRCDSRCCSLNIAHMIHMMTREDLITFRSVYSNLTVPMFQAGGSGDRDWKGKCT